jgi:uncharacterized tellurite resistance protein B-like protein
METTPQKNEVIQDLALIYIALAHATDQHLDDREVSAIAERLRRWQSEATSKTVLSALKEAMENYMQDEAQQRVHTAIQSVAEKIPVEQLNQILDDLTEVAIADGKFLHGEGSFIGELSRAWDVHFSRPVLENAGWWSVLHDRANSGGGWKPLHHLALVYLTLAHGGDKDLSDQEMGAVTSKLQEWVPDADGTEMLNVVRDVMTAFAQGPDKRLFDESIEVLRHSVPSHQREALLSDLMYIAEADGVVLDEERRMIDRLSQTWHVPS